MDVCSLVGSHRFVEKLNAEFLSNGGRKWWPVCELSQVICQVYIVFFWIAFLIDLRVMLLPRVVVLSFAPSLAATSAISFPLISAFPPIQLKSD